MNNNVKLVKKYRRYTNDFKKSLVSDFESGRYSIPQLSRLHNIDPRQLYNWIYKFSTFNEKGIRIIEMEKSSTQKLKELEKKVKELERIVGQKQIKIDYLEKMIDLAKDELKVDIKKNFDTPPSSGSGKTKGN